MMDAATPITAHHLILLVIGPCLFALCAPFRGHGWILSETRPRRRAARQSRSRSGTPKLSFHRGDHGKPGAPLLIIEGDAGVFRRLFTYQKSATLAMDRVPCRRERRPSPRIH